MENNLSALEKFNEFEISKKGLKIIKGMDGITPPPYGQPVSVGSNGSGTINPASQVIILPPRSGAGSPPPEAPLFP